MTTKRQEPDPAEDSFFGVPATAVTFGNVKFDKEFISQLKYLGFKKPHIQRAEKFAGRYQSEFNNSPKQKDASKAKGQLIEGLSIPIDDDEALLEWLRGLNPLAVFELAKHMLGDGDDEIDILRSGGGPKDVRPNPKLLRSVRKAIPAAAKLKLPKGRPQDDAIRNLIWGLANLWREVTEEWPKRSHNQYGKDPKRKETGPFVRLVRRVMAAAGADYAQGIDHILREIGDRRREEEKWEVAQP